MRQYTHEGPPEYLLPRDVLPFKIETDKPLPAMQTRKETGINLGRRRDEWKCETNIYSPNNT